MVQLNIELTDLARWAGQLGPGSCQGYRHAPSTATDTGVLTHVSVLVWRALYLPSLDPAFGSVR